MAKLHGTYENLMHGSIEYALRDLTAGHVTTNYWQYRSGTVSLFALLTTQCSFCCYNLVKAVPMHTVHQIFTMLFSMIYMISELRSILFCELYI
jgi:hypothetical protein